MALPIITPLVAGNWKMHGLLKDLEEARHLQALLTENPAQAEVLLCPPTTLIHPMTAMVRGGPVSVGAQDCHSREKGAYTGDISAKMLADLGARYVIVGHSERREDHNETSEQVREKALAAHNATLSAIICVGETISQRDAGWAEKIVLDQLAHSVPDGATASNTVIAYEPIWAIGTGRIPKPEDVAMMHQTIRDHLADRFALGDQMRILYGGSVKASNAHTLMAVPNVNGALVGGASLKALDFNGILDAYRSN